MVYKLSILLALAFVGCSQSHELSGSSAQPHAAVVSVSIPAGFSVIE